MGCQCIREKEAASPLQSSQQDASPQTTLNRPIPASPGSLQPSLPSPTAVVASGRHRRTSAPGPKLRLQLPSAVPDNGSSPASHRSKGSLPFSPTSPGLLAVPHSKKSSVVSPRSPWSGGLGGSWKDLQLTVRLREVRLVEEGWESCYEREEEVEGSLRKARHRNTLKQCWVQTTARRTDRSDNEKKQYLGILRTLDHPNVLKVLDLIRSHTHYALIYEATEGGSAASLTQTAPRRVISRGIKEQWAAEIMRQVLAALRYCHARGLTFKFLSLQSILFPSAPSDKGIQAMVHVPLGENFDLKSPYIAPELLNKSHFGPENDLYSCGVVLSNLLITNCISSSEDILTLPTRKLWGAVSPEARALVSTLLSKDYESRGTVEACMQHPWIALPSPRPTLSPCLRSAIRNMASARPLTSLKKTLFQLLFTLVLSSEDLKEAKKAFQELDTDKDGTVTEEELRVQMYRLFPEEQAQAAFAAITSTAAFSLQRRMAYSEFLLWATSRQVVCSPANLVSAFRLLDRDNDRKVTGKELREVLSIEPEDNTDSYTWRLLMVDISNSPEGTFNYAQFAQFLTEL